MPKRKKKSRNTLIKWCKRITPPPNSKIENCDNHGITIPAEAWRAVLRSKFMNSKETGRLLLFTSKYITNEFFDGSSEVWDMICRSHFGDESMSSILQLQHRNSSSGPEQLQRTSSAASFDSESFFRIMNQSMVTFTDRQIQTPKYGADDYILSIQILDDDNVIYSKMVSGDKIYSLFKEGSCILTSSDEELGRAVGSFSDLEFMSLDAKCNLIRIPDRAVCCLLEGSYVDWDCWFDDGDICEKSILLENNISSYPAFSDLSYAMQLLETGYPHCSEIIPKLESRVHLNACSCSFSITFKMQVALFSCDDYLDSVKYSQAAKKVTAFHFIEALAGWKKF